MADKIMTQREYAAHRGISQPCVAKYVRLGKIPKSAIRRGRIVADLADAALDANLDPTFRRKAHPERQAQSPVPGPQSLTEVRTLKEKILAEKARIELEIMKRNLIKREEVEALLVDAAATVRAHVLSIPSRAAPEAAVEDSIAKIEASLKKYCYEALSELAAMTIKDYDVALRRS